MQIANFDDREVLVLAALGVHLRREVDLTGSHLLYIHCDAIFGSLTELFRRYGPKVAEPA